MIEIRENVPLAPLTTFGIGGVARWFFTATDETDVREAFQWANDQNIPVFVLGGGSNLLVRDGGFNGLVLQISLKGIQQTSTDTVVAAAGELWDAFVDYAIGRGLAGVECLAGIPGSVGG